MLPVDLPTLAEFMTLAAERSDACVSLYLETTPITQDVQASRIALGNMVREAIGQLEAAGLDKRRLWPLAEQFDDLAEDDGFWAHQAMSLAVLATPDRLTTYRLANRLAPTVQVADRFHLKPLLRALTHPHAAYVLALSENGARLVEFFADMAPEEVRVPAMPRDAASAVGRSSINDRSPAARIVGSEGKKVRLRQYARAVDAALRPVLTGGRVPLILAANPPVGPIFRSVASYPHLLAAGLEEEVDRLTPAELTAKARPILDAAYAAQLADRLAHFARREDQHRATTDIATAARAAAQGAIETVLVDMDTPVPGTIDPETGAVTFADHESAATYGIVDQIAVMALATGAEVLSVRAADLPRPASLAATLRYRL
jgi:hypothetical protein